ncbi:MAG TPA: hypothetical protein VGP35_08415 [Terriglobales bacterium]|nr:hypothetical protein [Terriglobales bacterium]
MSYHLVRLAATHLTHVRDGDHIKTWPRAGPASRGVTEAKLVGDGHRSEQAKQS